MSEPSEQTRPLLATIKTGGQFGPIQAEFHFDLKAGYTALFGANNAGKSALLQLIFRTLMGLEGFGPDGVCFILPDRQPLAASNETAGRVLASYNNELNNNLSTLLQYESAQAGRNDLGRLLLHHSEMLTQIDEMRRILIALGLPRVDLGEQGTLRFAGIQGFHQGSGLRALYPIAAALTDPRLRGILIDEPELSLEPTLQKALRDLLIERARDDKAIIVASHSHLFIDRKDLDSNHIVRRIDGEIEVRQVGYERELLDLVFKLLGNSTEDLFFPGNYIVVEGGSDQTLVERALQLLNVEPGRVKVAAASGITSVRAVVFAVKQALLPLIFGDSPYKDRVVALIDEPSAAQQTYAEELREELGERLIELPAPSVEEYMPDAVYEAAGMDRKEQLERITSARDFVERTRIKSEIAKAVADVLDSDLLDQLPHIKRVAELALAPLTEIP